MSADFSQAETNEAAEDSSSQFAQLLAALRSTNLGWLIFIGSYVLLMPQLFLEPGVISAAVVLIHASFFTRKLHSVRGDRLPVLATIVSGALVYGGCWLLIAIQIRSNLQSLLLQHPYHLAPLWDEHWAPIRWYALFLVVTLTMLFATQRRRVGGLLAMFTFWAILILPTICYLPWVRSYAAYFTSPPIEQVLQDLEQSETQGDYRIDYKQRDFLEGELWKLFRVACLTDFQPSERWCLKFEALLKQDQIGPAVWEILGAEPWLQRTIDTYLEKQHGLDGEIDASLAASTLDRLGEGEARLKNAFLKQRIVELVSPHLDRQQLVKKITESSCNGMGIEGRINWYENPETNALKPWVYAAIFLNQKLNNENPPEYNELQNSIGRHQYRNDPPTPMSRQTRWIMNLFRHPETERSELDFLAEMVIPQMEAHRRPLCAGYESDEFLRRRWLWSLGSPQQLGSTKVKESEFAMLFLDSIGGKQWRRANRERVLEVARRSIALMPKKSKIRNRDSGIALGAVMSVLSFGKQEAWPIPSHLEFLFLDHDSEPAPSLAFEFWPDFNTGVEKLEKANDASRLSMRWNYLAKMWPESNPDMFVNCYMKAPTDARQECLLGVYMNSVGIPRTIPVSAQLEILQRIREELQKSAKLADGVYREHGLGKTNDEHETLDYALFDIDSIEGAKMYLELYEAGLGKRAPRSIEGYEGYSRVKYQFSRSDHKHAPRTRRWLEDRMTQLSKHQNPKLRILAIQSIKVRPVPEYMPLLESLRMDSDDEVRMAANDVAAFLNKLRSEWLDTAAKE